MRFYRVYIELTNQCGLSCSFCPTATLESTTMSLDMFDSVLNEVSPYTKEVACHVMGDPLTLPNLDKYLDLIDKHGLKALLTTSGYFIKKHTIETLLHPAVKQVNISLNSYNKNDTTITLKQYMAPILQLCKQKINLSSNIFINLRVWNLDESMSEHEFNSELFSMLQDQFEVKLDLHKIYKTRPKNIRLEHKTLLHFDNYFNWPSLSSDTSFDGTCQGLSSHVAILASGVVVPCCLDADGIMSLGNISTSPLSQILSTKRVIDIVEGFKKGLCTEELCKKCSYKDRFN